MADLVTQYLALAPPMLFFATACFAISLFLSRSDIADVAWGIGFFVVSVAGLVSGGAPSDRSMLVSVLVGAWAFRLSLHIFFRNRGKTEDRRYAAWRESWGRWFPVRSFFQIFVLQGILLLIIAMPIVAIHVSPESVWTVFDLIGVLLWTIGFVFESVGDFQLLRFLRDPAHRGGVLSTGLWKFTRHPNYFGEVTVWWGIWFLSLSTPIGAISVLGPLTITFLILFVSGIPLLERGMAGNPKFEEYARRTNIFFPWFPKKKQ